MGNRLIISCGGTGGHFYPGLSVARYAEQQGHEAVLLLSGVNSDAQSRIAAAAGVRALTLPLMPSPSPRRPANSWRFLAGLFAGCRQSSRFIAEFRPDAALGMGSFASLPVVLAAHRSHVPIYLHDGNARIGRANRWLSKWARGLYSAFPAVNADKLKCPVECIGMPLRESLAGSIRRDKPEAISELNRRYDAQLRPELPTLLIFGGSQGAEIFNRTLPATLAGMSVRRNFQVLHLTGSGKLEATIRAYEEAEFPRLVLDKSEFMELFYDAADLVVCRSGGSTVAELALFGKPAVLIPYPAAAEQHQHDNAYFLLDNEAALMIENAECTPEKMQSVLELLYCDPEKLHAMARHSARLGRADAAKLLLEKMGFSVA